MKSLSELELGSAPEARALCLFSVDVEDWFHSNFQSARAVPNDAPRRVEHGVDRILDLLAESSSRATFFVLGVVAAEHPRLVSRIARAGHEIASHSWEHTLLYSQTPEQVREHLHRARALLQDQSGQPVRGFRAPSWSITEENLWALDVIADVGFEYDSSIFPAATHLYGIEDAPRFPYTVRTRASRNLLEIPPSTLEVRGRRFGMGGGAYLRVLPLSLHLHAMRRCHRARQPFMAYVHPREVDRLSWQYRLPLSLYEGLIHRFGLARAERRIRGLLERGPWQPLERLLNDAPP